MLIANESQYPTEDVMRLVRYASRGMPMAACGVHVKDLKGKIRGAKGLASGRVRPRSLYWGVRGIGCTVMLEMGPPSHFPMSNLMPYWVKTRYVPIPMTALYDEHGMKRPSRDATQYMQGMLRGDERIMRVNIGQRSLVAGVRTMQPYGGKGSPVIETKDWQETLVVYAAHEARHIWQFVRRLHERRRGLKKLTPRSEVDAEKHAAKVLAHFRRDRPEVLAGALRLRAARVVVGRDYTEDRVLYNISRLLAPFPEEIE